jgi:hypothetical protein
VWLPVYSTTIISFKKQLNKKKAMSLVCRTVGSWEEYVAASGRAEGE